MLAKILGWLFVGIGILFFIRPNTLREKLKKKSIKRIKKYLCIIAISIGILLIKASWGIKGILAKAIIVLGILAIVKGFFFIKGKASEKVIVWFSKQSLLLFRFIALIYLGLGIIILLGFNK